MPTALDAGIRTAASLVQLSRYDEAYVALTCSPRRVALGRRRRTWWGSCSCAAVRRRRPGGPPTTSIRRRSCEPADPDYCFNLGYAYWLDKEAPAAAYWLREAVRRDPADGDAHFVLAAALAAERGRS